MHRSGLLVGLTISLAACGGGDSAVGYEPDQAESASACFNGTLDAVGSIVEQTYEVTDATSTETYYSYEDSWTIMRQTTFNDQSVIERDRRTADFRYLEYRRSDASGSRLFEVGGASPDAYTWTYDPPLEWRFALEPGQSYTVMTFREETPSDGSVREQSQRTYSTTYFGRERVSVPAGNFDTCKFEREYTYTYNDGSSLGGTFITWLAVGSGLNVRREHSDATVVLTSAAINGQPVTGD